jgi:hypothetical protein
MRKRLLSTVLSAGIISLLMGVSAFAAPKTMPDGATFDPQYYAATYPDVAAAFGTNEALLYQHYVLCGKAEGRQPYAPGAAASAQNTSAGVTGALSPAQAVEYAYQQYMKKGMSSEAAFAKVKECVSSITGFKTQAEIENFVNSSATAISAPAAQNPQPAAVSNGREVMHFLGATPKAIQQSFPTAYPVYMYISGSVTGKPADSLAVDVNGDGL